AASAGRRTVWTDWTRWRRKNHADAHSDDFAPARLRPGYNERPRCGCRFQKNQAYCRLYARAVFVVPGPERGRKPEFFRHGFRYYSERKLRSHPRYLLPD